MIIAKNITESAIILSDLNGISIAASSQVTLTEEFPMYKIAASDDLLEFVGVGDIVVNTGSEDLDIASGLRHISGIGVIEGPKDDSGKIRVHQTSRPFGTARCWTGEADANSDVHNIWGGVTTYLRHQIGESSPVAKYLDFNCVNNRTWLHEGLVMWEGCKLDFVSLEVVPRLVSVEAGENTNYNLVDNYLVVPAAGDGTISLLSDITAPNGGLVRMTPDDDGVAPQAFWDADYNSTTKLYENIAANPYGTGEYNMFSVEVILSGFVKNIPLLGDGFLPFKSSDKREFGHGMRVRLTGTTNTTEWSDHDWTMAFVLCLHRETTR